MTARRLNFPAERSLGRLWLRPRDAPADASWEPLGEARGTASIPADMAVRLELAEGDLAPLAALAPDDLDALAAAGAPLTDDDLIWIRHLTGLTRLDLCGAAITNAGMAHLAGLVGLQELDLSGTKVDGYGLAHLAAIPDLRHLTLRNLAVTDYGAILLGPHHEVVAYDRWRRDRVTPGDEEAIDVLLALRFEALGDAKRWAVKDQAVAQLRAEWAVDRRDPEAWRRRLLATAHAQLERELRDRNVLPAHTDDAERLPPARYAPRPLPDRICVPPDSDYCAEVSRIADLAQGTGYDEPRLAADAARALAEEYPLEALPILVAHAQVDEFQQGTILRSALVELAKRYPVDLRTVLLDGVALAPGAPPQLLQRHASRRVKTAVVAAAMALGMETNEPAAADPDVAHDVLAELARDPDPMIRDRARWAQGELVRYDPSALPASLALLNAGDGAGLRALEQRHDLSVALWIGRVMAIFQRTLAIVLWTPSFRRLPPPARRAVILALRLPRALLVFGLVLLPLAILSLVVWLIVEVVSLLALLVGAAGSRLWATARRAAAFASPPGRRRQRR